jgi:hypothetical protein
MGRLLTCTRKVRYRSETGAKRSAEQQVAKGRDLTPYYCGLCGGYHLTKRRK